MDLIRVWGYMGTHATHGYSFARFSRPVAAAGDPQVSAEITPQVEMPGMPLII